MTKLQVIERIRKDCEEYGHGRKKWWAENLGIHQQTLSYWLHGQRTPRAYQVQQIFDRFSIMNKPEEAQAWASLLRNSYFNHQTINQQILVTAIKTILSSSTVEVRTLAFLSYILEVSDIEELYDSNSLLRNRLGWLLEMSGKQPNFRPAKTQYKPIINAPGSFSNPKTIAYLKKTQTPIGKRWHIYDADLSQIKRSFIGRLSTDR